MNLATGVQAIDVNNVGSVDFGSSNVSIFSSQRNAESPHGSATTGVDDPDVVTTYGRALLPTFS